MNPALRRYLQLDVFAGSPGAGNPLGVVFDAQDMDPASMQAFAAWTNLSETIFLLPPRDARADYRVRIFTPRQELPFAGHPSVGAAWAALDGGIADANARTLTQECAAGLLPVRIADAGGIRSVHVRAPRATPQPQHPASTIALLEACVRTLPLGTQPAALWNNGPGWWLVELVDERAVRTLQPDLAAIAALTIDSGAVGLAVYARAPADSRHQLVVRAFCPADNIPEDPVTGSANACIAALLADAGALPGAGGRYRASQGREVGRDGVVDVEVDAAGDVWIGGQVQRVIAGSVLWPDDMRASP
ncbi:PhzF family phenazine biosynthesis protein [Cognatiluteimonas profundi]|uniref:PhzF family phenazine biosynthesis protein n=1 Tax=Cognatiluteimonas profundi TaxID=2594501 RepID=UPI00131CDF71|nr:PhzF family phenazine biosynthesis protein [Lysobacter profundi]